MSEWIIKYHPDLIKDLDELSRKDIEIFYKKKEKIKQNPLRLKHLSGGENCYREPITRNIRLIYYIDVKIIWFLTVGKHDEVYAGYLERLHTLRTFLKE